jgi:hypothetical protein
MWLLLHRFAAALNCIVVTGRPVLLDRTMFRVTLWVGVLCTACTARDSATSVGPMTTAKPVAGAITKPDRVPALLERLRSREPEVHDGAVDELCALARGKKLSAAEGVELVRATAGFPASDDQDTATRILDALAHDPRHEYVAAVQAVMPRLGHSAKHGALRLLAAIDDPGATTAFVDLLRAHAEDLEQPSPLVELANAPHQVDAVFPAILPLATHPRLGDDVLATTLAYCRAHQLTPARLAGHTAPLLAAYHAENDWIAAHQGGSGVAWLWADDYAKHRREAALLLESFACLPPADVDDLLATALALQDPKLVAAAALSLVDHGRAVPADALARAAASPEVRAPLYDALARRKHPELFPVKYATQDALAESAMVTWLAGPTELGRAPDAIERMKTVGIDTPEGPADLYLFRFRTGAPHWAAADGWLAGIAGPFPHGDRPTTHAPGTFSDFERWESREADEHVALLRARLDRAARLDH